MKDVQKKKNPLKEFFFEIKVKFLTFEFHVKFSGEPLSLEYILS